MVIFVFFGPSIFKSSILARTSPNLQGKLAQKSHELSRAETPPARAESELNRAELSSDASLIFTGFWYWSIYVIGFNQIYSLLVMVNCRV